MLSVLMPIFNKDVIELVNRLQKQCDNLDSSYEILCYDDCSQEKFKLKNRKLSNLLNVSYVERAENLGRSKIRNRLAKNARFDNLIFLDCDVKITQKDFVAAYLKALDNDPIVFGGVQYQSKKPTAKTKLLHWRYGVKKEIKPLKQRLKKPYELFTSANFAANRDAFLQIQFDENIKQYGHEDSLFARDAKAKNIRIGHIENPILHIGLKTNKRFMDDVDSGVKSLITIKNRIPSFDTKLSKTYELLQKYGLDKIFAWYYSTKEQSLREILIKEEVSLRKLDLYKLVFYHNLLNSQK